MAGQVNWPGQEVTAQPTGTPGAPPVSMLVPPTQSLPTPQNPEQRTQTVTTTAHTQQEIEQSNTAGHNATAEMQLHQQYRQDPRVQNYEAILPVYRAAQTAADNPAGDLDIVTAFAKMMDPSTGVREGEAASVADAASPGNRAAGLLNYVQGGGRLTPEVRQQLLHELASRGAAINNLYNSARADYRSQAQRYGFDPNAIIGTHAAIPFRQQMGLDNQQNRGDPTFWDDPTRPIPPGAAEFQADLQRAIGAGTFRTPEQIVAYGANYRGADGTAHHFDISLDQARAVLQAAQAGRRFGVTEPNYAPLQGDPSSRAEQAVAGVRGATSTLTAGLDHPLAALEDTFAPWGQGGTFRENLWRQNAYDQYNEQNHPWATLAGDLVGAAALPTRAASVAQRAARNAILAGATREEALAAARRAAAVQLGMEGAVYGGIHGAATSDGDLSQHIANGALEAAIGFAAGRGLGRFGVTRDVVDQPPLVDPTTGRLNEPLEAVSPGQRVGAALDLGINLPLGAATDRGGAIVEKGLDISPVSAGVMNDARREASSQAATAAENVAGRYGAARTLDDAGQAAQAGARAWIARAQGVPGNPADRGIVGKAYDAIPISPNAPTSLTNTRAALADMTSRFQSNPELAQMLSNPQLQRYQAALENGNLSWQDLKDFRSHIGEQIGEARFSDSPTRTQLRGLYGALSEDMRASASAQGPQALRAFERANNLNRDVENRIETALTRILGDDSRNNPERAAAALQTISQSGRGSGNISQLAQIRASMGKGDEWNNVASALIRLGGQPAGSEGRAFNPQTFINWYSGMTEPARNILFGGAGRQDLRKALDNFVAVSQRLAGTDALRNTSQTASSRAGLGTVAGTSAATAGLITHPVGTIATMLGAGLTAGANFGLAKLWTSPAFVRWATGYTRMVAGAARAGVQPTADNVIRQRQYLQRLARSSPALAQDIGDLDHRLFGSAQSSQ